MGAARKLFILTPPNSLALPQTKKSTFIDSDLLKFPHFSGSPQQKNKPQSKSFIGFPRTKSQTNAVESVICTCKKLPRYFSTHNRHRLGLRLNF